jgi:hypothetical protein
MESIYLSEAVVIKDHELKEIIIESNGRERRVLQLEGLFQRANEKNRNGRIYPLPILEREASRLVSSKIKIEGGLIGEMEHPIIEANDPNAVSRATKILYERACIMIKDLRVSGDDIIGKCEILDDANQYGATLASMARRGHMAGISSRAVGSKPKLDSNGGLMVNEDIQFVTWDIVSDPSVHNARLKAFISEEVQRIQHLQKSGRKTNLWQVLEKFN